jgi:hypothetical protein
MGGGMEAVAATAEAVAQEVGLGSERCGACPRAQPLAALGPRYFEPAVMAAAVAAGHQELPVCPAPAVRALSKAPIVNGGDRSSVKIICPIAASSLHSSADGSMVPFAPLHPNPISLTPDQTLHSLPQRRARIAAMKVFVFFSNRVLEFVIAGQPERAPISG